MEIKEIFISSANVNSKLLILTSEIWALCWTFQHNTHANLYKVLTMFSYIPT
jgi:hypothetical protein